MADENINSFFLGTDPYAWGDNIRNYCQINNENCGFESENCIECPTYKLFLGAKDLDTICVIL